MFKQGLKSPPSCSPLGVKKLGVYVDEGEGSGFSKRKVVQGSRGFPSQGLPKLKPHYPEQGWRVAMRCGLQPKVLGSLPFPLLLWDWLCCYSSFHCDQVTIKGLSEGAGGPAEPLTRSSLLDDFLLGDSQLGDGRGGLDNCGDGSRQELVGLRPRAAWR